mmetsp:Transcript_36253/g.89325  ORF Transcript_36253/g.89325 Transcript_36253/m.89325 type:complete len:85 (+) Transcript_36253:249-503(+)
MPAPYGQAANADDVMENIGSCSICQESFCKPIKLRCCKHVFCEECVSEWFEREKPCPLCRAVVKSAGLSKSFGDGATPLHAQIF